MSFGYGLSAEVSLLIECSLNVDVYVVFAGETSRLVVPDIVVRNFKFNVIAVYVPHISIRARGDLFCWGLKFYLWPKIKDGGVGFKW